MSPASPLLRFAAMALAVLPFSATAQTLHARILTEIDSAQRVTLPGSRNPRALPAQDVGSLPAATELKGMSLVFRRTEAQEADLQALLAAQSDPASPLYHQWLTPEQFAARFGVAASDQAKVTSWLEAQGFTVEGVARGGNRISFSGTAGKVESAFGSPLHNFTDVGGETHFAPVSDLSLPAALSGIVEDVSDLSSFRPRPHVELRPTTLDPNFTSSQTGSHFLTPKDVATIYDVNAAYNAGYTGTGQSIAVVGQSAILLSDIEKFQTAAGLPIKDPTVILVPNTGTSTTSATNESESDLDLEYSGAIAKGATIYFVYTGSNKNTGVFSALQYAISNRIAPILSVSYGTCETNLSASSFAAENAMLAQAAAQGQTVVAAAGDAGSTDCSGSPGLTTAQQQALAVDFPSDSQYVTGMGGTELLAAAAAANNSTYWTPASGSDVIGSALSYIPEQVWNDDSATGISSGGGGVSQLAPRPTWQTGVTGIPSGSFRVTPDISLDSAVGVAPYLYCSSDTATKITGSCSNGFRDASNASLTAAGGTSFAAPIFSGMLALINQRLNSTGQGVINPTLYTLAANGTTYARAFHDITTGSNACTAGATLCSTAGASAYSATTGYDQATGLGSIDLYNLLTAWPAGGSATLLASTTTLAAATTTPASGANDVITITVAPSTTSLTTSPTGTVSIAVDGGTVSSSVPLSGGVASYTFSSTVNGSHVVTATYSGDSVYAPSDGTLTLNVGGVITPVKSILLSATNLTITAGATGSSTITVTPAGGYTGTVSFSIVSSVTIPNTCYSTIANATVSGASPATTALTISTSSATCAAAKAIPVTGNSRLAAQASNLHRRPAAPRTRTEIAWAALLLCGLCGCRSRRLRSFAPALLLAGCGLALSGCASRGASAASATTSSVAAKGTYTLTVIGTDISTSSITSTTSLTLVIN